jgi:hypothetical protein
LRELGYKDWSLNEYSKEPWRKVHCEATRDMIQAMQVRDMDRA